MWARLGTTLLELGATEALLRRVGALVSVDLPDPDDELKLELPFGDLEGLEGTVQLHSPVESRIVEVNRELIWNTAKLEKDPYGEGWLLRIEVRGPDDLAGLMNAEAYEQFCAAEAPEGGPADEEG
ncbi:MAG: glycine cleavage system protein H [Candidatus Brocadiaceae bacterium]|nr:glycine cleavage system protein H [Candidatus Brocadiaceae bacterium]